MKIFQSNWLKVVFVITIMTLFVGCAPRTPPLTPTLPPPTPTLDDSLSPPIIGETIYACAEMISFGGADRDSKIIVYVNGTEVTDVNTWMGWGAVRLPNPLNSGDTVSAAQVVDNRISEKTREPVTVINIPPGLFIQDKLKEPEIVPPLYECQKVVRVRNVLEGATVVLRNWDGDTWEGMTPYSIIRLGTPELRLDQKWYNALQRICEDKPFLSDWSEKETVQEKPASMPEAIIHEPIVVGNDACRVDDLIPGAVVKIYADNGSGPVDVGGGTALESATIFKIDPPFDADSDYYAIQALCDLESELPEGIKPHEHEEVPSPTVQEPLCRGDIYVTICDTVVLSTIKVYVNGTQVAQAAGNGGCVTMALGNATVLSDGDEVTAEQLVAGNPGPPSAPVPVEVGGAPAYDPGYWNNPAYQGCNNCYNYGCDIRTDTFAQPGYAHQAQYSTFTCTDVGNAAIADGLVHQPEKQCTGCTHLVALVIATVEGPGEHADYHWYRLDDNGRWSHKPGPGAASELDASDNPITNPETADRRYVYQDYYEQDYILDYRIFCTYYCVDKKFVVIDGSYVCNP